jgi:uncharacterized radical SAM superfamily Fe-S cluster-containing enzyme
MRIIDTTRSLCGYCFERLDAEIVEDEGMVYLLKTCPQHGEQKALIWADDAASYMDWTHDSAYAGKYVRGSKAKNGCPYDCGYCSDHRGTTCTAVIEVTDRCNMRCRVCFADADMAQQDAPMDDIKRMIDYVAQTQGFCSLQLSGGEPTLRDDLPDILRYAKSIGFRHIQVNTNGVRIAGDIEYTMQLAQAGVDLIYLGFDGVSDAVYEQLRGRSMIQIKTACIENCRKAGIGVMLVPVVIRGINDLEIGGIAAYAKEHMPVVKGIHFQPGSAFGRYEMHDSHNALRYTIPDLLRDLQAQTGGEICPCHILPRKKMMAHCSMSAVYYLNEQGQLIATTKRGRDGLREQQCCDKDVKMHEFARKTNDFTQKFWKQNICENEGESALAAFNRRVREYSLTISAMPFQDVWNIDIKRVQSCCVSVISRDCKAIPLCLYYLTDATGNRLYRGGVCTKP